MPCPALPLKKWVAGSNGEGPNQRVAALHFYEERQIRQCIKPARLLFAAWN